MLQEQMSGELSPGRRSPTAMSEPEEEAEDNGEGDFDGVEGDGEEEHQGEEGDEDFGYWCYGTSWNSYWVWCTEEDYEEWPEGEDDGEYYGDEHDQ